MNNQLPETGFIRLTHILGQSEVTPEQAAENKHAAKVIREQNRITAITSAERKKQKKILAKKLAKIGPRSPRPAITGLIPWSKSKIWEAVRNGEFPAPVKLSQRTTAWSVESIREFLERMKA